MERRDMFWHKKTGNVSLGTARSLGQGRIFYRLNAGMNFERLPALHVELLNLARRYQPSIMIFELEQLTCFSGACLATFVDLRRHLPEGARFYVVHVNQEFRGIVQISHLSDMMVIVDDMPVSDALEILAGAACTVPEITPNGQ
jgi:anti-anti-sigma regulatory factor